MINDVLINFPEDVRDDIAAIVEKGGVLTADSCHRLSRRMKMSSESLMIELLPVAASYSIAPISCYHVGAVVRGAENSDGYANLYVGANFEFEGQALGHTLHAEQAAISNAWLHGETSVTALAISAPPCGHCRQFLYEVAGNKGLDVLLPKGSYSGLDNKHSDPELSFDTIDLLQLLPAAFGPLDLGCEKLLMDIAEPSTKLSLDYCDLKNEQQDKLVDLALAAANSSYAPYSDNFAGCALQLTNGEIVLGRYAENAAYNPSLPPFVAALSQAVLHNNISEPLDIKRAVLVESATNCTQKNVSELLLKTYSKNLALEYFQAK